MQAVTAVTRGPPPLWYIAALGSFALDVRRPEAAAGHA